MNKKLAKKISMFISIILAFFVVSNVSSVIAFSSINKRAKDIDFNITPGLINYEEIKEILPRIEYTYKSQDETLCGYFYKTNDKAPLVVISGGYNSPADSLLNYHKYFVEQGFNVFAYDNSGTGKSSGKQNGFVQPLIDLKSTLEFINQNEELTHMKTLLFGYSAGGFASAAIFNFGHYDLFASASIEGYNDGYNLMMDVAFEKAGLLVHAGLPAINILQSKKFKEYKDCTAFNGINKYNVPIYIIHNKHDDVISYDRNSIYFSLFADSYNIKNKNTKRTLYNIKLNHEEILYSQEALEYQKEVNETLKKIRKYEDKKAYVSTVDDEKYSQTNSHLINTVIDFYKNYI